MTGRRALARRYAVALAELAHERGLLDAVEQALGRVLAAVEGEGPAHDVWYGVGRSAREKVDALRQVLGTEVPDLVYRFLGVVASKGREPFLAAMKEEFDREADRLRQVVRVDVEAAAPLSEQERAALEERLAGVLQARGVKLSLRVNPDLIGGLVVRAGDLRIDGSLSRQLGELRERLRVAPIELSAEAAWASRDGKAG